MNGLIKFYRYRFHREAMVWTRDFALTICGIYAGNVKGNILVYSECALYLLKRQVYFFNHYGNTRY
jgi:hypothetical protein